MKSKKYDVSWYILSILYVLMSYLGILVLPKYLVQIEDPTVHEIANVATHPITVAVISLIYIIIFFQKVSRITLLRCALFSKYALLPLYLILTGIISHSSVLMLHPFTFIMGPTLMVMYFIQALFVLLGSSVYSMVYIRKANIEGVHGKVLSVFASIFQFCFATDVLAMIVLTIKEKKNIIITILVMMAFVIAIVAIIAQTFWGAVHSTVSFFESFGELYEDLKKQ